MKSASAFVTASVRKCFHLALLGFGCSGLGLLSADQATPQVRVEYAPQISGRVESDIQQMRADGFWLNSGAVIEGTWFLPGTPRLTINGRPDFGGVIEGSGSPSPSGYVVGINQGVSLTHLGNRTDSEPMPAVSAPPSPAGRRNVTIDRGGQSPGDFATLRNLTLNANVGAYTIPAGAYGDFTANRGTSFVLGEEGATRPSVYSFQRLNLNAGARLELLGPVIIHLRYGGSFNGNIGREGECDWLSFLVYSGDCTLNSDSMLWGHVVAPSGQVTVNARSYLEGSVMAKRLTVNAQGVIRGCGNPFDAEECLLYPIGLSASILDGLQPGAVVSNAMQGTQPGQFGWLSWQGATDVPSLVRSLTIPGDSFRYVNADDPSDTELSAGDWVHGNPGVSNARGVRDALDGLLGLEIILPVWSQSSGQGRGARYQVVSFARVRLLSYKLSGAHRITFRFLGYADCGTAPVEPPFVEDAAYETFASTEVDSPLHATDPAGLSLTYTITLPPSSGTLSGEAPNLRYTPADGFLGLDSFRFVASNGVYESIPATVTITVLPRNRAPVVDAGEDQSLTLDSPYAFTLSGSASDDGLPAGSTLSTTWTLLSGTGEATIAEASQQNTSVTVSTPGVYTFRLTATDGELSASDEVTVTVAQTNREASFTSEPLLEVAENTPYLYVATAEDPDVIFGDTLTLEAITLPDWLTATTIATGELRMEGTPSRTEVGSHSVLLRATDSAGVSVEQSFTITVLLVNQAPVAQDAAFSVVRYGNLSDVLAPFASDPDGQTITFSLISDASNGSLSFSSDGSFTYSPDGSYYGTDSFTYQVSDGALTSRVATVTITVSFVNRAPVAENLSVETLEETPVDLPLVASDADGDPLQLELLTLPASGTVEADGVVLEVGVRFPLDAAVRYVPASAFSGVAGFAYAAWDGVETSTPATVTITVLPRNRAPVVDAGEDQSLTLDSPYAFTLSGSASDDGLPAGATLSTAWTLVSGAGEATIAEASQLNTAVTVSTPGSYTFRLTATDGELSASDELTVTVVQSNREASFTSDPVLEVAENTPYLYIATAEDPDAIYGDTLTLEAITLPDWLTATTTATGELRLEGIPSRSEVGSHSVLLRATDSDGASVEQSFTITVLLVNQAPLAQDAAFSVVRYGNLSDTLAPFASDPDGQAITFSLVSDASNGNLSLSSDGSFTYSPDGSYFGTDSFTFQVSDGALVSRIATVSITVSFVNRAPVAEDLSVETLEETPVGLPLLASDVDGDALQLELLTLPSSGTIEADGVVLNVGVRFPLGAQIRYVPAAGFSGVAGFTFAAWDGVEASAPATVTITVLPRNRAPVVDAGADQSLTLDSPYTFTLSGSASDDGLPAGSTLSTTWTLVSGAGEATITKASQLSTSVTVSTPGVYAFRLTATDGELSASDEMAVGLGSDSWFGVYAGADYDYNLPKGGKLMSICDVHILSDIGFDRSPDTVQFATNVANYFTNGGKGKFLINRDYYPTQWGAFGPVWRAWGRAYSDPMMSSLMRSLGHQWIVVDKFDFALSELLEYDGLFLEGNDIDPMMLKNYVDSGGNVYIAASDGVYGATSYEVRLWNPFTQYFGFQLQPDTPGLPCVEFGVSHDHPVLRGVSELAYLGGTFVPILKRSSLERNLNVLAEWDGMGRFVVYHEESDKPRLRGSLLGSIPQDVVIHWEQVEGPASAMIDLPDSLETPFTIDTPGLYRFRVTASAGSSIVSDEVMIDATAYYRPVVDAGVDQMLYNPADSSQLTGDVAYPRVSLVPDAIQTSWSLLCGPQSAVIASPESIRTDVAFAEPGLYSYEFAVNDGTYIERDIVEYRIGLRYNQKIPLDVAAWWTGNHHSREFYSKDFAFPNGHPEYSEGQVSDCFSFDGEDDYWMASGLMSYAVGKLPSSPGASIEFWVNPERVDGDLIRWSDLMRVRLYHGNLRADWSDGDVSVSISAPGFNALNRWYHVACTYDKASGMARIWVDGIQRAENYIGTFNLATTGDIQIGSPQFKGQLDEITLYDRALTRDETIAIFQAGSSGKPPRTQNRAPVVDAGADSILRLDEPFLLQGMVSDDGLPESFDLSLEWSVVYGPQGVDLADPSDCNTSVTFANPGIYVLELVADDGMYVSRDTVELYVGCAHDPSIPLDIAAWWPGNGNAVEVYSGQPAQTFNWAAYASGMVSQSFDFDGVDDYRVAKARPSYAIGSRPESPGASIEFWVNRGVLNDAEVLRWSDKMRLGFGGSWFTALWSDGVNSPYVNWMGFSELNRWYHVVCTYDKASGMARLWVDGVQRTEKSIGTFDLATTGDLQIGSPQFKGQLDEITLYDRALTPGEVTALYESGEMGKPPFSDNLAPVVNAGPDQVATVDNGAVLSGQASDDGLPAGSNMTTLWSLLSGPEGSVIAEPTALQSGVTFTQPGIYVFELSASDGMYVARDTVEVRVDLGYDPELPEDIAAWWPGNSNAIEVYSGQAAQTFNGAAYAPGRVSQSFDFDGVDDYRVAKARPSYAIGSRPESPGASIEFWMNRSASSRANLLFWSNNMRIYMDGPWLYVRLNEQSHGFVNNNGFAELNRWYHVVCTYDKASGMARLWVDGVQRTEKSIGTFDLATTGDIQIGSPQFKGQLDELTLYDRALTPGEITALYESGEMGKPPFSDNLAPVVNAGPDQVATVDSGAVLIGQASDDGKPAGSGLATLWSLLSGPEGAVIVEPTSLQSAVNFTQPGIYVFELSASDGMYVSRDTVEVRVDLGYDPELPEDIAAWWPGNGNAIEVYSGQPAQTYNGAAYAPGRVSQAFNFDGMDDYRLAKARPSYAIGSRPESPGASIEFWVNRGVSNSANILYWSDNMRIYMDGPWLYVRLNEQFQGFVNNNGLSELNRWYHVVCTYDKASGMARLWVDGVQRTEKNIGTFDLATTGDIQIGSPQFKGQLDEITLYDRALTPGEITALYESGEMGKPGVDVNTPPQVSLSAEHSVELGEPLTLSAVVLDDGFPNPPGAVTLTWEKVSGSGEVTFSSPDAASTEASLSEAGTYVLSLRADDGDYYVVKQTAVTVTEPLRPISVELLSPRAGVSLVQDVQTLLSASISGVSGFGCKVEFYAGDTRVGEVLNPSVPTGEEFHYYWEPAAELVGPQLIWARVTDPHGRVALSGRVSVEIVADAGEWPEVAFVSPADADVVTAPVDVTGTASSSILEKYEVEYRACGIADAQWVLFASGTESVVEGVLGRFDPTLLRNGSYEMRLTVYDRAGRIRSTSPRTILVEGGMKVGVFALSFEDLNMPVQGIPLRVVRTYDSRDALTGYKGDFGLGWTLSTTSGVRVVKNRHPGQDWMHWYETETIGEGRDMQIDMIVFKLEPDTRKVVSVVLPDDTVHSFRVTANPSRQNWVPIQRCRMSFEPIGKSQGHLEVLGDPLIEVEGADLVDLIVYEDGIWPVPYDPTTFKYVSVEGDTYIIDSERGLLSMEDRLGNKVTYDRDTVTHSAGKSIEIERDDQGRVTHIAVNNTDPDGNTTTHYLTYRYDAATGMLDAFWDLNGSDPESPLYGSHTSFLYQDPNHPALLTDIHDAEGNPALSNHYDEDGRLIGQTDATGASVSFNNDMVNHRSVVADRLGNETIHYYDVNGNIVRTIDALGGETTYAYDDRDNKIRETDPNGHTTEWRYDERGNMLEEWQTVTDASGSHQVARTSYTYDANNNPLSMTDAMGYSTDFAYDVKGNLTAMTDAMGNTTSFTYDHRGFITSRTNPDGSRVVTEYTNYGYHVTDITYDAAGNELTRSLRAEDDFDRVWGRREWRTLPDGTQEELTTRYRYDGMGNLIHTIYPDGTETSSTWNALGQQLTSTDVMGRVTSYAYDSAGNLTLTTHPDGTTDESVYDAENRLIATIDREGVVTLHRFDALGRQTHTFTHFTGDIHSTALPAPGTYATVTEQIYDAGGRVLVSFDERGTPTYYEYDDACSCSGRRSAVIDALGNETRFFYDLNGNMVSRIDASGNQLVTTYDALNRPVTTSHYDASGTLLGSTSVEFDASGRRSASVDEEGKRTTYGYDAAGRLTTVSRMINGALKLQGSYAYDTTGRQISQTDALGRTTTYAYDNMGRRTSRTLPEGQSESATYDTEGKPATRTDFNGDTTTYAYDPLQGWLLSETPGGSHSSATGVSYTYDASGRRTSMTDASGITLWTYDTLGRLASVTQFADSPAETTLHYSYEGQGNLLTGMQSSHAAAGGDGAQVAYTYDTLGRLQSASNGLYEPPLTTSYGYDAVGNLATVTHNSGVTATYTYDGRNRLADLHVTHGATGTLATFGYTRDRVGNTTRLAEQIRSATGSAISRTVQYSYDDLHRLTSEVLGGSEETGTVAYTLDDVGNRLGRTSSVSGITPQSLSYSANDWLNSHQYDANGNTLRSDLTSGSVARDAYDFKNRLSQRRIYDASGTVLQKIIDLRYDGDGSLKWKRVTDTTTGEETIRYFVVDHHNLTGYSQIVEELDATGAVVATYHYGHDLISQSKLVVDEVSGVPEWVDRIFVYDGGGSVRALTDLEGNITDTFSYDAYGNLLGYSLSAIGSLPTAYLYRGERYDPDLGQYYLRARFYNSDLGRFHTLDEYEGRAGEPLSLHKYLYAHANPVTGWDPSGRMSLGETSIGSTIKAGFAQLAGASLRIAKVVSNWRQGMSKAVQVVREVIGIYPRKIGGGGKLQPYSKLTGKYVSWNKTIAGKLIQSASGSGSGFLLGCAAAFVEDTGVSLSGGVLTRQSQFGYDFCRILKMAIDFGIMF